MHRYAETKTIGWGVVKQVFINMTVDAFVSNKILKVILEGLYEENCPLSKLRGCYHVLKFIWSDVRNFWKSKVRLNIRDPSKIEIILGPSVRISFCKAISHLDSFLDPEGIKNYLKFPESTGINIKMMPFLGKCIETI